MELAHDAVGCSTKQHLMCKGCAARVLSTRKPCPLKCNGDRPLVTVCMADFVQRIKNKITIECNECGAKMELGSWDKHACPNANKRCTVPGCAYVGHSNTMAKHHVDAALKHNEMYQAAFGHLRQLVQAVADLEHKASTNKKRKVSGRCPHCPRNFFVSQASDAKDKTGKDPKKPRVKQAIVGHGCPYHPCLFLLSIRTFSSMTNRRTNPS
jgi:hypothetical protein